MEIYRSPSFLKAYRKLSFDVMQKMEAKEEMFLSDPFSIALKTHKLKGKMSGLYAFSMDNKYRVVFEFIEPNIIRFLDVGTHDVYE